MKRWSILLATAGILFVLARSAHSGDREVAEQIAGRFQASGQLRAYNLRVKFQNGTAWLLGRVASEQQRSAAVAIAFRTQGVERVVNGLTVWTEPKGPPRTARSAPPQPTISLIEQARAVLPATETASFPSPQSRPKLAASLSVAPRKGQSDVGRESDGLAADLLGSAYSTNERCNSQPQESGPPLSALRVLAVQDAEGPAPDLLEPREEAERSATKPLDRPQFAASLEACPATVQKASYSSSTGKMCGIDLNLIGTDEPMLLPDEPAGSVTEILVSDCTESPPALLNPAMAVAESSADPPEAEPCSELIQCLPEPARRARPGDFFRQNPVTMRAIVGP